MPIKMRKIAIISFLVFLLTVISVSAAPDFKFSADDVNISSKVSNTITSTVTIVNTGTTSLDINFTDLTLTKDLDQLTISSLNNITNLAAGSSKSQSFSVVIPAGQSLGKYTGTLKAANGSLSDPATITKTIIVNVEVTPSFTVTTVPTSELNMNTVSLNSTPKGTFTITNTGTGDLTSVFFDFSETKFSFHTDPSNFIIPIGEQSTINFNISISKDTSTGNVTLGSVKIRSTELNTTLFSLRAEISGGLIIEDLDVFLSTRITRGSDGLLRSETGDDLDISDGDKLNFGPVEVGPESEIRFNFNIENTFTDDEGIDISDITITVIILEIDDGDDLEEESDEFDLDAGENNDIDVYFDIPLSVIQDTYDVTIEMVGEDDSGNTHSKELSLKLKIDKKSRDVIVSKALFFPDELKCSGSTVLTATIKNLGSRIENEAQIKITSKDLNINFEKNEIEMDDDPFDNENEYTKKLTIDIDRHSEKKTYPIIIESYLQEGILWDSKTVNLVVEPCSGEVTSEPEPESEEDQTSETETVESGTEGEAVDLTEGDTVPVLQPETTIEIPLTKKPGFWIVVILSNIIIIAAVVFLIVKGVGKRSSE